MNKWIFLVGILVTLGAQAAPTEFERLGTAFNQAQGPQKKAVLGYWAGSCVHAHDPNTRWPAVYVNKTLLDSETNTERVTQTYFWERNSDVDFYKRLTVPQLLQHTPYVQWAQREQWSEVEIIDQAFTNTFKLTEGGTIVRSVRVIESEFSKTFLLRVLKKNENQASVISFCELNTSLGSQPAQTEETSFWMRTGAVGNTFVDIQVPFQHRFSRSVVIRKNAGANAILSDIQIVLIDGKVLHYGDATFEKGPAIELWPSTDVGIKVASIRFAVIGTASQIEVFGKAL